MSNETNTTNPAVPTVTVFLDTVGRTILGELVSRTEQHLTIKNPVIFNVVPADNGRMTVQLFPVFFKEFLADKTEDNTFTWNLGQITESNISALDFRLLGQYAQMFNPANVFVPANEAAGGGAPNQAANTQVVNLFDE
jgi:hypothetical protein